MELAERELVADRTQRYRLFDRVNEPYLRWQTERLAAYRGRRILEVGCGVGSIAAILGPVERFVGIDVDPDVLEVARSRFHAMDGYHFLQADFGNLDYERREDLRRERFDTALCINLLEHLGDDAAALATIADLLVSGGYVYIVVPAHQFLYGRYDAIDGHYRRYTRGLLHDRLSAAGFAGVELRYFNAVGAIGWWIHYKLLRRAIHGTSNFSVMNKLVPWCRAVEERMPPPFGLSVLAVARKP